MFLFCLVFAMSLCAYVYMCFAVTCWERADLLALVCGVYCKFVTFPLVSWVRCGTLLYRFLIFAPLLTLLSPTCYSKYSQLIVIRNYKSKNKTFTHKLEFLHSMLVLKVPSLWDGSFEHLKPTYVWLNHQPLKRVLWTEFKVSWATYIL